MKELVNKKLIPILETELQAANVAGTTGARLGQQADQFGSAAERAVEDVRRLQRLENVLVLLKYFLCQDSQGFLCAIHTWVSCLKEQIK